MGVFYHEGRVKKFPRQFLISNSGFPGAHNFEILKSFYKMVNPVLEVYRNCGEILSSPVIENSPVNDKIALFKKALRKAGREIFQNGKVSPKTVEQIHIQLISEEEYMQGVNKDWDEKLKK